MKDKRLLIHISAFLFWIPSAVSILPVQGRPAKEIFRSYIENSPSDPAAAAQRPAASNLDIRLVTAEADAVLAILQKLKGGEPIDKADWNRLFMTEGYVRLKKREAGVKRPFEDAEFREFVLSSELLAKTDTLGETLVRWKRADMKAAAACALAYLPAGTAIRVKVYPVIKPKTNSFVFGLKTNPAIFLYLNPDVTEAQFENTVAHELHHIGYASACLQAYETELFKKKPAKVRIVIEWIGAFGEGVAMLAAAGGPDVHPHAVSPVSDHDRWDRDMANFNADLKKVEDFFLDILDGRLKDEEKIREVAFSFMGIQGPWYTVGWKMAVVVEKTFGRAKLIDCLCDPVAFLAAYNEAAGKHNAMTGESLALWSAPLIKRLNLP
jgi:hypothetical protein